MASLNFEDIITVLLSTYSIFSIILFIIYIIKADDSDDSIDFESASLFKKIIIYFSVILLLIFSLVVYSLYEIPRFSIQTLSILGLITILYQLSKCYIHLNFLNVNFRVFKASKDKIPANVLEKFNELTKLINSYNYLKMDNANLNKKFATLEEDFNVYTDDFLEEYNYNQKEDRKILEENLYLLTSFHSKLEKELSNIRKSINENEYLIDKNENSFKEALSSALQKITSIEADVKEKISKLQKVNSNNNFDDINTRIDDITKAMAILSKEILQLKNTSNTFPINDNSKENKNIKSFENDFTTFNVIQNESSYTEYMKKF